MLPDASVSLFGSRAYGIPHDESDWDILILIKEPVTNVIKNNIHDAVFPISVQIAAFINTLIVQKNDWESNPTYYSIQQTTKNKMIAI